VVTQVTQQHACTEVLTEVAPGALRLAMGAVDPWYQIKSCSLANSLADIWAGTFLSSTVGVLPDLDHHLAQVLPLRPRHHKASKG
jgi:hypothetical protein